MPTLYHVLDELLLECDEMLPPSFCMKKRRLRDSWEIQVESDKDNVLPYMFLSTLHLVKA